MLGAGKELSFHFFYNLKYMPINYIIDFIAIMLIYILSKNIHFELGLID